MVHAGCVFVAGIHPSRTLMSGSFESVRLNGCAHRRKFGLYSHPKEFFFFFFFFWGNGVRTNVNHKGKISTTEGSEEDGTRGAASCRTAQLTTEWAIPGPKSHPAWPLVVKPSVEVTSSGSWWLLWIYLYLCYRCTRWSSCELFVCPGFLI